jgi:inorganic pyrophosphatase/exopolyphosphatase
MIKFLTTKWRHSTYYKPNINEDKFIIVDVSNPDYFDPIVNHNHIEAVFDHHHGYNKFWSSKIEVLSLIEPVGACATLVWEQIVKNRVEDKLDNVSYKLLLTAIVSNSLNFNSKITSQRDIDAYEQIISYVSLRDNWTQKYFEEVSENIFSDPISALLNDKKYFSIKDQNYWIGQIELWNASPLITTSFKGFMASLFKKVGKGFANIISISEGINYLYTDSINTLEFISSYLPGVILEECFYKTERLWLRKEIIKLFLT